ncbi:chemotaxis phosphatase CheZ [Breoghania corrubedonensis]|uniref:Chemotaxis phosphatase CheZ n=1 Tax=Breoghania corrubedonensis TaxID=665038 RepID=A0A2T5V4P1_9HYPH|nr:protein phosphatase CheZ [Breoghania corrubedonensis]PTW58718.1 chemotaxis phosphatase CheZ [Breoghania corrubedonensis]
MAAVSPPSLMREEDYEAIENAVMETSRGRWFLAEFARRNRTADTGVLLEAIGKLEGLMRRERKIPKLDRIQLDLADMQEAIARTKREISQIKSESSDGDRFAEASIELDAIVNQTEGATQDILHKAELIQEMAWTLREKGVDEKVCDDIDAHTTDIFMACSFQDLTGQRTQKVVQVLRYLESRINEMMEIWDVEAGEMKADQAPLNPDEKRPDAHLLHGPQSDDKAIKQNTIDALMGGEANFMADDDMGDGPVAPEVADDTSGITADNMEFDAIDTSSDTPETDADEAGAETAEGDHEIEAVADTASADADDDDMMSGDFDINDISFDKVESDDAAPEEAAELDATTDDMADDGADDEADDGDAATEMEAEADAQESETVEDLIGAEDVLEDMLDANTDDEFAAFGAGLEDNSADSETSDDEGSADASGVDETKDMADASMSAEPETADIEIDGFETDEDEEDADQAFMDMEATADEEDEDEEADPLRALSAGERLALFS